MHRGLQGGGYDVARLRLPASACVPVQVVASGGRAGGGGLEGRATGLNVLVEPHSSRAVQKESV